MTRFPAEWEKQSAILIAWPHPSGDFGQTIDSVEQSYRFIAKTISQYQPLYIVYRDADHKNRICRILGLTDNIQFIQARVNDIWVRDTVFLTVEKNGSPLLLNFRFNGWGGKYPYHDDNELNRKLFKTQSFQNFAHSDLDLILEGGSIESDGLDTLMTTRQCLLNPNRNKGLNQNEIEQQLRKNFGASRIFWIDQANLSGDDTDAHIDTLARFCPFDIIAYSACNNPEDSHYDSLKNMERQLQKLHTRDRQPYRLLPLPLPSPILDERGRRLPANYANFLFINGAIMMPVYDDPMDQVILTRMQSHFPDRIIIPTPCGPIVQQYGSLHCMTMQFPVSLRA